MRRNDSAKSERAESESVHCERCGIGIIPANVWSGDNYGWRPICAGCAIAIRARKHYLPVEEAIGDHVRLAVRFAAHHWPRPKARAWRRAYARGYFRNALIGNSLLHFHIDEERFVERVDVASHAYLTDRSL
ncbi:MAG: hypothetical protein ACTHQM_24735 [Thermoanaerobaculia bacterium]